MIDNQSLLEGKLQSSASKFDFTGKKRYYLKSQLQELNEIAASGGNFNIKDIQQRSKKVLEGFIDFVKENGLVM